MGKQLPCSSLCLYQQRNSSLHNLWRRIQLGCSGSPWDSFLQAAVISTGYHVTVSLSCEFKIWYRYKEIKTFEIISNYFSLLMLTNLASATVWSENAASGGFGFMRDIWFNNQHSFLFVCFMQRPVLCDYGFIFLYCIGKKCYKICIEALIICILLRKQLTYHWL